MADPYVTRQGIILHRELAGEHHLRLHFFGAQDGLSRILFRQSSRKNAPPAPDLFDQGIFTLEARGGSAFAKEFLLEHKFTALSQDYTAFQCACQLAEVYRRNTEHLHDPTEPARILQQALEAFARQPRPDVTLFKSLYLLARSEGLPAKEHFLAELPLRLRQMAASVLREPLSSQKASLEEVSQLNQHLRTWLGAHADFVV